MSTWSKDELHKIAETDELHITRNARWLTIPIGKSGCYGNNLDYPQEQNAPADCIQLMFNRPFPVKISARRPER